MILRVFCPFSHLVNLKTSLHSRVSRKLNRENRASLSLNHLFVLTNSRNEGTFQAWNQVGYVLLNSMTVLSMLWPPTFRLFVSLHLQHQLFTLFPSAKSVRQTYHQGTPVVHWLIINIPILKWPFEGRLSLSDTTIRNAVLNRFDISQSAQTKTEALNMCVFFLITNDHYLRFMG
jgi:hypothetical protein